MARPMPGLITAWWPVHALEVTPCIRSHLRLASSRIALVVVERNAGIRLEARFALATEYPDHDAYEGNDKDKKVDCPSQGYSPRDRATGRASTIRRFSVLVGLGTYTCMYVRRTSANEVFSPKLRANQSARLSSATGMLPVERPGRELSLLLSFSRPFSISRK
jgi:hypothetical protein